MENLPRGEGFVPICAKMLCQGNPVLVERGCAKPGPVLINSRGRRPEPGHEAGAGRVADRSLAMSICEKDPPLCQSLDIRSNALRMPSQPDDPVVQVIDGYHENIGPGALLCTGRRAAEKQGNQQHRAKTSQTAPSPACCFRPSFQSSADFSSSDPAFSHYPLLQEPGGYQTLFPRYPSTT